MVILDILAQITTLAKENGIPEPFIVGGLPRDKMLGRVSKANDIDLTTGDESIHKLADLCARTFHRDYPNFDFRRLEDGHAQMTLGPIRLDFSSSYYSPSVDRILGRAGVADATPLKRELFSRDFTCNTLLATMNLAEIKDLTGLAIPDINRKILRTPLPPAITLSNNIKRIARIPYLAAKLGFEVEPEIIQWVRKNPELIARSKPGYVRSRLQKAMDEDPERTVYLMGEMRLWRHAAIPDSMRPYMGRYRHA